MDITSINLLAVLTAALSMFLIGGLWYSNALFAKAWMKESGLTEVELTKSSKGKIFGFSFVFALIMALNLATFLNTPETDVGWGIGAGALTGFGWVALGFATVSLFELRSWKYIFINGGYLIISFIVMGAIIGAWR
jgi:hypothetical protein